LTIWPIKISLVGIDEFRKLVMVDQITPYWTYKFPPGTGTHYSLACSRVNGEGLIAAPGQPLSGEEKAGLFVLDSGGHHVYSNSVDGPLSPFLSFLGSNEETRLLAYWSGVGSEALVNVLNASDFRPAWTKSGFPWIGNGDFLDFDVDRDGREELLFSVGGHDNFVSCNDLATGEELWRYDDRVTICWGRLAIGDIDMDGDNEVVFGTEYGNPRGTSSIVVLSSDGQLKWRNDSILGDAGSTPTMLADVNGDGFLEILKVEIDLCGKDGHISSVLCMDALGPEIYSLPFGGSSIAIADVDGDGSLEGLGLTNGRDGGNHDLSEMVCLDLAEGKRKWTTPVPRAYLSGDPVIADITEADGLDTLVSTGMPSGYGRIPGKEPWGSAFVFSADGDIEWRHEFPDWAGDPLACDIDSDGYLEFLIPSYEGRVCAWKTRAECFSEESPKVNGGPTRTGLVVG
jgi:outer membrane protein assembly factor BamB